MNKNRDIVNSEFDKFFEFDSNKKTHVTSVSCKLFAEHMIELRQAEIISDNNTKIKCDGNHGGASCGAQCWNDSVVEMDMSDINSKILEIAHAMKTKAVNNSVIKDTTVEKFADEIIELLARGDCIN